MRKKHRSHNEEKRDDQKRKIGYKKIARQTARAIFLLKKCLKMRSAAEPFGPAAIMKKFI